jgi:hypothetical protein
MPARPSILRPAKQFAAPFLFCLCLRLPAVAQQAPTPTTDLVTETRVPLPDSPRPQPTGTLTLGERFHLQFHSTLGVSGFVIPAGDALVDMARPPKDYPREWRDGGAAFGRLYGAEFARHTTAGFTHFAVAAIDREDPRYFPSPGGNYARRAAHAIIFTIVDRSTSGHRTLAVSNLAGGMAAGSVGIYIYPHGYNDFTHAYQRGAIEVGSFGSHNLIAEFSPEIVRVLHKLHVSDRISAAFLPAEARGVPHHP